LAPAFPRGSILELLVQGFNFLALNPMTSFVDEETEKGESIARFAHLCLFVIESKAEHGQFSFEKLKEFNGIIIGKDKHVISIYQISGKRRFFRQISLSDI
jgi:hypothetical protein